MKSHLSLLSLHSFSAGTFLQNVAFYLLVLIMTMVIIVQLNAHQQTGTRRQANRSAMWLYTALCSFFHEATFNIKRLFGGMH